MVLASRDKIQPEELVLPASEACASAVAPYQTRLDAAERDMLRQALHDHDEDKRAAVRAMGIALSTFHARLKRSGL